MVERACLAHIKPWAPSPEPLTRVQWSQPVISALRKEDQKFKVFPAYTRSFWPAWDTFVLSEGKEKDPQRSFTYINNYFPMASSACVSV